MNALEGIVDDLNTQHFDYLEESLKCIDEIQKKWQRYVNRVTLCIESGKDPGTSLDDWEASDDEIEINGVERSSLKENIDPETTIVKQEGARTRLRRNASKQAIQNIQDQASLILTKKLRRPAAVQDNLQDAYVKIEKMSTEGIDKSNISETVALKVENIEMPAPTRPAPRTRGRKKKIQDLKIKEEMLDVIVKEENLENELSKNVRDSDVIVEEQTIPIVSLLNDSDEDVVKKTGARPKRSKRTRANAMKDEAEEGMVQGNEKRSKSSQDSSDEHDQNKTFVASSETQEKTLLNATVVLEKSKLPKTFEVEEPKKQASKPIAIPSKTKPIFSPFEQSPVKKKVQAFERLNDEARTTRTKTKAQANNKELELPTQSSANNKVTEMIKTFTPTHSKFNPKFVSTGIKSNITTNESVLSTSSTVSALKTSFPERERKRLEKEDKLRKREALLQAQFEEKKRKREERQLKAQQKREALEKEKMRVNEIQKLKEDRHRQLVAAQEERKQNVKEEQEKKRLQAKMRAMDEKQKEEKKRAEEQRKANDLASKLARQDEEIGKMLKAQQKIAQSPIYMRTPAPRLPTQDCYDSDEEGFSSKCVDSSWARPTALYAMQKRMLATGDALKNTFFSVQAQSADLQDIFEVIKPQKLKRSSSAIWHKPPRFTMIPGLEDHEEISEGDE